MVMPVSSYDHQPRAIAVRVHKHGEALIPWRTHHQFLCIGTSETKQPKSGQPTGTIKRKHHDEANIKLGFFTFHRTSSWLLIS